MTTVKNGAGCGGRTRMTLRSGDFKSPVYTNSTNPTKRNPLGVSPTLLGCEFYPNRLGLSVKRITVG